MPTTANLLLNLSPSSGVPIYRQVREQVTRMVASGQLRAGDAMPSVRQLATEFAVNPMTISKAYSLLEEDGLLERIRGIGMRVATNEDLEQSLEQRLALIQPAVNTLVEQIEQLQIPTKHAMNAIVQTLRGRR